MGNNVTLVQGDRKQGKRKGCSTGQERGTGAPEKKLRREMNTGVKSVTELVRAGVQPHQQQ